MVGHEPRQAAFIFALTNHDGSSFFGTALHPGCSVRTAWFFSGCRETGLQGWIATLCHLCQTHKPRGLQTWEAIHFLVDQGVGHATDTTGFHRAESTAPSWGRIFTLLWSLPTTGISEKDLVICGYLYVHKHPLGKRVVVPSSKCKMQFPFATFFRWPTCRQTRRRIPVAMFLWMSTRLAAESL